MEKAYDASKILEGVTQKVSDTSKDIQHFFDIFSEKISSNADSFQEGNRQSIGELKQIIENLSDKVVEIKNTIPAFPNFEAIINENFNSGTTNNDTEMLKQLSDIHLQVKDISTGFVDHMFPGIDKLNTSVNTMLLSLSEFKNHSGKEDDSSKGWAFFKRGGKR